MLPNVLTLKRGSRPPKVTVNERFNWIHDRFQRKIFPSRKRHQLSSLTIRIYQKQVFVCLCLQKQRMSNRQWLFSSLKHRSCDDTIQICFIFTMLLSLPSFYCFCLRFQFGSWHTKFPGTVNINQFPFLEKDYLIWLTILYYGHS